MATIGKFYFHDAVTPNAGTMPTGAFINSEDVTGDATGARTARAADNTIGALQTSSLVTATANQLAQSWGHRRFVSAPLAAQTFALGDGNWSWSYARSENNLNHNMIPQIQAYCWRPGTGAQVGTGFIQLIGSEPTSASTEQTEVITGAWGNGNQAILDGDILVFEIFTNFTQSKSSALTENFYYDGTTEASTTSCASFISPPSPIALLDPPVTPPGRAFFFIPARIAVPEVNVQQTAPGPATYDPTRDSLYDQIVLGDLPAYGAYWKMNEQSGLIFQDRGPLDLDITTGASTLNVYPGPDQGASPNAAPEFVVANGVSAGNLQTFAFPDNSAFSLEFWIYPLVKPDAFGAGSTSVFSRFYWSIAIGSGQMSFSRLDIDNAQDQLARSSPPPGLWSHIVGTYDGSTMSLYLNGIATSTSSTRPLPTGGLNLVTISAPSGNCYFNKMAIYGGTALTQAQVTEHLQAATASTWSPQTDPRVPSNLRPFGFLKGSMLRPQQFFDFAAPAFPVSQTMGIFFEAVQAITDTSSEPYEAELTLAATKSDPWEAIVGGIAATKSDPWEALQAISQISPAAFSTPVLDSFNRANEDPLSGGGNWANVITGASGRLKLVSNQVARGGGNGAYWTPQTLTDCEAYAILAVLPTSDDAGVLARIQDVSSGVTYDGYMAVAGPSNIRLYRVTDGNTEVQLGAVNVSWTAGDQIGIRCIGTKIEAWAYQSGVWSKKISATDTAYASGALGLYESDLTARLDDFGGGALGLPYEANQGIAATKSDPYEALKALTATASDPYEANQKLAVTPTDAPVDDEFDGATESGNVFDTSLGQPKLGQSFVALSTGLVAVELSLKRTGSSPTGDIVLEIQSNSGSSPDGVALASSSVAMSSLPTSFSTVRFSFAGIALTPGQTYWLVISRTVTDGGNLPFWEDQNGNPFVWKWYNGTTWFTLSGETSRFRLFYARATSNSYEALGGIAATDADPYEALQALAATKSAPLEALRALAATSSDPWEALVSIAVTNSDPWEANKAINAIAVDPWEANKAISATDSDPWEAIIGGIQQTKSDPWEANLGIAAIASDPYEALQTIAGTKSDPYEALKAIAATASDPWEALVAISKASTEVWEALQALAAIASNPWDATSTTTISQTAALVWEALVGITRPGSEVFEALQGITANTSDPFEAEQTIASTKSDPWEAVVPISQTTQEPWETLVAIASTKSEVWEALLGIANTNQESYEALQGIAATRSDFWDATGFVSSNLVSPWEAIVGGIASNSSNPWEAIIGGITSSKTEAWEALLGIATTTSTPWESQGNVIITQTASLPWDALQAIAATGSEPLEALVAISNNKVESWEALLGIAANRSNPYEALQIISVTTPSPYEALQSLISTQAYPYEALKGISSTSLASWEALLGIASTASVPWESQGNVLITQTASLPWDALQTIAATKLNPWEANLSITSNSVESWEALVGISAIRSNPLEALQSLVATGSDPYEALQALVASNAMPYEALTTLSATLIASWEALLDISSASSNPYESQGNVLVTQTASLPWDALKAISSPASEPWETIIGGITSTRSGPYEALLGISANSPEVYESLQAIRSLAILPWDATGVVYISLSATGELPYDALGGISGIPSLPLEAQKNLTKAAPGPYEATIKVSTSATPPYEALIGVKNPFLLPWEAIFPAIAKIAILPWEAGGRAKIIVTETGLELDGAYHPPNFERVLVAAGGSFVILVVPSELMEGLTETGLDIGQT
jgi:Concanavalin A-like lectin/glucanases superfamily